MPLQGSSFYNSPLSVCYSGLTESRHALHGNALCFDPVYETQSTPTPVDCAWERDRNVSFFQPVLNVTWFFRQRITLSQNFHLHQQNLCIYTMVHTRWDFRTRSLRSWLRRHILLSQLNMAAKFPQMQLSVNVYYTKPMCCLRTNV